MTAPHSDLPAAPAPPSVPTEQIRKPKWPYAVAIVVSLAVIVALLGTMIRLPYVIYSPGDATPVQGIVKISGARSYRSRGEVLFLTVAVSRNRPNVWRFLQAKLDDDSEIIGEDRFLGGQSRKQVNRENVVAMDDSQLAAKKVALEQLGYKVTATGAGALVVQVVKDSPASGKLESGDLITAIDGEPVRLMDEIRPIVQSKPAGSTFDFSITRKGRALEVPVKTEEATSGDLKGKPMIGIVPVTKDLHLDFPVDITIDPGPVSGPSAGLAFTLTIIDELTPGSLTGGRNVAVTGTMDLDGHVGEVGGVPQKTAAALDAGAKLMIVPRAEVKQARERAGDGLAVVGVDTIDQALRALRQHGGVPVAGVGKAAA
jgi:PDZ domain-containing protein